MTLSGVSSSSNPLQPHAETLAALSSSNVVSSSAPSSSSQEAPPAGSLKGRAAKEEKGIRTCKCSVFSGYPTHFAEAGGRHYCEQYRTQVNGYENRSFTWSKDLCLLLNSELDSTVKKILGFKRSALFSEHSILLSHVDSTDLRKVLCFSDSKEGRDLLQKVRSVEEEVFDTSSLATDLRVTFIPRSDGFLRFQLESEMDKEGQDTGKARRTVAPKTYLHTEWQRLVRQAKFDEAKAYLESHQPTKEALDSVVYKTDRSYCLRRAKQFLPAIKLLTEVLGDINFSLQEIEMSSSSATMANIKKLPWFIWQYIALINRAKCNLKKMILSQ